MKILQLCPPHLSDVATLPWKILKCHFLNSIIHTYFWLFCYLRRKQTVIHLPTPTENVTTLTCELQNVFFWLKVCCVLSSVNWRLWKEPVVGCRRWPWKEPVVMCDNWNVRQAMPQQLFRVTAFCINTGFRSFSTLISRTVHHTDWNSAHVATSHCRKPQHARINTRAHPVACPKRSTRAMQIIGSTIKQQ